DAEEEVPQREAEVGEGERNQRAGERRQGRAQAADPDAVPHPARNRRDVEELLRRGARDGRAAEVPRPVLREERVVERLAARLERRRREPLERVEEQDRETDQQQDEEALDEPARVGTRLVPGPLLADGR